MVEDDDDEVAAIYRAQLKDALATIAELEKRTAKAVVDIDRFSAYLKVVEAACQKYEQYRGQTFSREDKRILLRALGVRVVAYSGKSDFTATHDGQRWDLQLVADGGHVWESIPSDMLLPPVARVAATL
jgi:hypothetical protein